MRCVHEASLYESNCFLTLTYSPENLPRDGSLNKKHFTDFMKRLRFKYSGHRIRYFHCGEYGDTTGRPHYHACLFNFDFPDRKAFKRANSVRLDTSDTLERLWGHGFCTVGDVSFESAAYVARYIMKKVTGNAAEDHYTRINEETGEITVLQPEYTTMSRRPGIGKEWFDAYQADVFPDDFVIMRGKKMKPPRFYDSIYEILDPEHYKQLKEERIRQAKKHQSDQTPDRLAVRETVKTAQISQLKRGLS